MKNKITFLAWNIHFRFLKCLLFALFYFENWKYQKILILPNIWCTQISIWNIDIIWHLFWRYEFYHQAFSFSIAVPTILSVSWIASPHSLSPVTYVSNILMALLKDNLHIKIHSFKVYSSMKLSKFIFLCKSSPQSGFIRFSH